MLSTGGLKTGGATGSFGDGFRFTEDCVGLVKESLLLSSSHAISMSRSSSTAGTSGRLMTIVIVVVVVVVIVIVIV